MSQQPTPGADEFLVDYFAARESQRFADVNELLSRCTDREALLIKEAAVMGYVQGTRHSAGEDIPKDRQIAYGVLAACLVFPDLYPTITGWTPATDEDDEP